jgi:hypothetical protein
VFTPGAVEAINFWARFSGKADPADFVGIQCGLPDRIGVVVARIVSGYLSDIVDALWIGADLTAAPDPWPTAGLSAFHDSLGHAEVPAR